MFRSSDSLSPYASIQKTSSMAFAASTSSGIMRRSFSVSAERSGASRTRLYRARRVAASDVDAADAVDVVDMDEEQAVSAQMLSATNERCVFLVMFMAWHAGGDGISRGGQGGEVLLDDDPFPAALLENLRHRPGDHVRLVVRILVRNAIRGRDDRRRRRQHVDVEVLPDPLRAPHVAAHIAPEVANALRERVTRRHDTTARRRHHGAGCPIETQHSLGDVGLRKVVRVAHGGLDLCLDGLCLTRWHLVIADTAGRESEAQSHGGDTHG